MPNTSATGGYLDQTAGPTESQDLRRFLQSVIVGVTGLDGSLVRQNWQPNPPPMPAITADWCGFGIIGRRADANAFVQTSGDTGGSLLRHEENDVLCSFYGPSCLDYAGRLRDGLQLSQNREQLFLVGMGLIGFSDIVHVPELVNQQWFDRADITWSLRRVVGRAYQVLSFVKADGVIVTDPTHPLTRTWSTS